MPMQLSRIFRRVRAGRDGGPVRFGSDHVQSDDRLTIESGPLAGTALRIERRVTAVKADFALYEIIGDNTRDAGSGQQVLSDPVAHCHYDRDPETGLETLWGIFIRSEFRHRRLATLLVRTTLRELLSSGRRHWFAIRKLMQVDSEAGRRAPLGRTPADPPAPSDVPAAEASIHPAPQPPRITLHNVGIGMVALRLGLRPEPDVERLVASGNVKSVQALLPDPPSPPGLLLRLESLPGLLAAVLIDPETGQPPADPKAYERFINPRDLVRQAMSGQAIIGNIDYVLPRTAIDQFASRLANRIGPSKSHPVC